MYSSKRVGAFTRQNSWNRTVCFRLLGQIDNGYISVVEGENVNGFGDINSDIHANITIVDQKAYQRLLWGGSVGAAEAYVEGLWYADSVTSCYYLNDV